MKISIIGGGGRVGSNAAFALQCYGIVSEIHLLDANEQMAIGEALDLMHGASIAGDQKIYAGGYDRCADADLVCITAGLRRKPDESRLDLINRNVTLFRQILDSLNGAVQQKLFERTKNSGSECLKTKGGAGWAVGLSIVEVIHAIAKDQPQILPVSTQLTGEYDIRNTCISVPTTVGRTGVIKRHEIELWPREHSGMIASAKALDATYAQVK